MSPRKYTRRTILERLKAHTQNRHKIEQRLKRLEERLITVTNKEQLIITHLSQEQRDMLVNA